MENCYSLLTFCRAELKRSAAKKGHAWGKDIVNLFNDHFHSMIHSVACGRRILVASWGVYFHHLVSRFDHTWMTESALLLVNRATHPCIFSRCRSKLLIAGRGCSSANLPGLLPGGPGAVPFGSAARGFAGTGLGLGLGRGKGRPSSCGLGGGAWGAGFVLR